MKSLEAIHAAARAELDRSPRAAPWWVDAAVLAAANALVCGVASWVMPMHEGQHASELMRWAPACLLALVAIGGAIVGLRPGGRAPLRVMAVLLAIAVGLVVFAGADPEAIAGSGGLRCAGVEWALSLLPAVAAVWALSRFETDLLRSMVTAGAAGAAGVLVLHFHCANGSWWHLASSHALPWATVMASAALLRRRLPSSSFAP